jgi:hypothetical protein
VRAIRARLHAAKLPAIPASGDAVRDIDAAAKRLELAESEWAQAVAASDTVSSGLSAAKASRDTVAALGYLAHTRHMLFVVMAQVPGSEPPPAIPQDPSACGPLN